MTNEDKTREQLLEELEAARQRNADLEVSEARLREAEKALAETAHLQQFFLDSLPPVAMLLRPRTREIVACNRAGEAAGAVPGELCYRTWGQSDRPCAWCLGPKLWETGEAQHLQTFGVGRYWDAHWIPVADDLYLHYATDITEPKQAEEALRKSEERFRIAIQNSEITVFEQDLDLIYTWVHNPHPDLTAESVAGKTDADLVPAQDAEPLTTLKRHVLETGVGERAEIRFGVGAQPSFYDLSLEPLRDAVGNVIGITGASLDITERKRAEEERRSLEAQVQQAQKLESLGIVAGGIAHDFNNLLMGILGNADLALYDLPTHSPARPLVKEILQAGHQAAGLTNQMLAYSGKGRFVVEEIDINALVRDMSSLLASSTSKKVGLEFDLAENLPAVMGDATQIRQIALNFVSNASEAIGEEDGQVKVTTSAVECDHAWLRVAQLLGELSEGCYVAFEISDTGSGMDDETKAKAFDPFFTTKFTGRGLGLAAVYGIVRGHKGAIQVESEPGEGTTFTVYLPALDRSAKTRENQANEKDWPGSGTILLVDDQETVRRVARRTLERLGFEVITAEDGGRAVDVYRERHDEITCVLLDLSMPQMDGEETFAELQKIKGDVRVILSSGYSEEELDERFAGKGLAGFIQKPYSIAALREKLAQVLEG